MKHFSKSLGAGVALLVSTLTAPCAGEIQFRELYELLKTNLAGADDASLDKAAAEGLLNALSPRVMRVGQPASAPPTNGPRVELTTVYYQNFGYLRIDRVVEGIDRELKTAFEELATTNRLKGLVVDLRFTVGDDYAAAAGAADLFFSGGQPLLDWGGGVRTSAVKDSPISLPVAVLVNHETSGAAEALAAVLRQGRVALLLGTNTAGRAGLYRDFTLSTGQRLRVATAMVRLGDGSPLPASGLRPDIAVEVSADAERLYLADAFAVRLGSDEVAEGTSTNQLSLTGTNRPPRRRINEAELVRMQREGRELGAATNRAARAVSPRALVTDPVLARALDLLKGLTLVEQFRSR
jgi:hypothetical protein